MDISTIAYVAAMSSWNGVVNGFPFGGSLSWLLVVLMSNDSGEHPYAPFVAAAVGWPITLFCDVLFLPASTIMCLTCFRRAQLENAYYEDSEIEESVLDNINEVIDEVIDEVKESKESTPIQQQSTPKETLSS